MSTPFTEEEYKGWTQELLEACAARGKYRVPGDALKAYCALKKEIAIKESLLSLMRKGLVKAHVDDFGEVICERGDVVEHKEVLQ